MNNLKQIEARLETAAGTSKRSGSAVKGVSPRTQKALVGIATKYSKRRNREIARFQKTVEAFLKEYPPIDPSKLADVFLKAAQSYAKEQGENIDYTLSDILDSNMIDREFKVGRTTLNFNDVLLAIEGQPVDLIEDFYNWV